MSTPISAPYCLFWCRERMTSRKFVIYQFPLLIVLMGYLREGHAQSCSWNWHDPPSSTYNRSVGAPAKFNASVNDILSNSDFITWKSGTTDLSIEEYSGGAFSTVVNARSFRTRFEPSTGSSGNSYILEFPAGGVTLGDDGGSVTVTSQGCTTGGTSSAVVLTVRYCDLNYFVPEGNPTDTSNCGYNCTREFGCSNTDGGSTLTFQATCQEDATWSQTTPGPGDRCQSVSTSREPPTTGHTHTTTTVRLQPAEVGRCEFAQIIIGIIEAVSLLVGTALVLYMKCETEVKLDSKELVRIHFMVILSVCLWATGLGICLGMPGNEAAFIATSVIGSLAVLVMAIVDVLYGLQIRSSRNNKGIKGKVETALSMD